MVIGLLRDRLEDLLEMWPALVPVDEVPFEASRLFGAAADVEILVYLFDHFSIEVKTAFSMWPLVD